MSEKDIDAEPTLVEPVPASEVPEAVVEEDEEDRGAATYAGWAYLAFLFALFLLIALVAYGCDDDNGSAGDSAVNAPVTTTTEVTPSDLTPVALEYEVDGTRVTLRGSVPDDGARIQLVDLAVDRYGDGNVVDELVVDDSFTLAGGTLSISGSTVVGDDGPEGLQADLSAALGLAAEGFDVSFEEIELTPIDVEGVVAADSIALSGVVPDQATVDGMVTAAEAIWGVGNVDGSGLTVDPIYTLVNGSVRLTGISDAGDTRVGDFVAAAEAAFGVTVDNQSEIDDSAEALGRLETRLRESLAANPILFATGSADIDPASEEILQQAAAAINAAPGIAVEIVGHTDDQGAAGRNQELSELRAQAVLDRLVELGVDADRLTARGAGEDEPIAENDTDEGRAANRRIAFEFEGAGGDDGAADDSSDGSSDEEEG